MTPRDQDLPETACNGERVTDSMMVLSVLSLFQYRCWYTHGGMREISVDDPAPGEGGLRSVVSMRVQPSPLAPQLP